MRVLTLVEGSLKEIPTNNPLCVASFSFTYTEAATAQKADLNVSVLAQEENNVLVSGKDIDSKPLNIQITATEDDLEGFSNGQGINPQKVIAYLFRVASDLLATDPKNPN